MNEIKLPPSFDSTPECPPPILLNGTQQVAKFNKSELDDVRILLALYRLKARNVDLVFVVNIPINSSQDDGFVQRNTQLFEEAARSLHIVDFGLFA